MFKINILKMYVLQFQIYTEFIKSLKTTKI